MAFVNEKDKHRTINYERNAVLVPDKGVGMSRTLFFELQWNGEKIRFGTDIEVKDNSDKLLEVNWTIAQIQIPSSWKDKQTLLELKHLISEAMEAYGYYGGIKHADIIKVSFSPAITSFDFHSDLKAVH